MNTARMDKLNLGCWRNSWEAADSTIIRKQKWLFISGCKHISPFSTKQEFLKLVTRQEKCISVLGDLCCKINGAISFH
jgi:hypothetical protein